jgi:hypothetical protein
MIWVTLRNTQGATLALSWLVLSIPPAARRRGGGTGARPLPDGRGGRGRHRALAAAPQDHVTPRRARPGA